MAIQEFVLRSELPVSAQEAYAWHERPGAFARLAPPWGEPRVVLGSTAPVEGRTVEFDVPLLPGVDIRWAAEFKEVDPGRSFRDVQLTGPFASFDHRHGFEPAGERSSVMEDRIRYSLEGGALGNALAGGFARKELHRVFSYRHRVLRNDLAVHSRSARAGLRILVSGATGLIGGALVPFLESGGHEVHRLTRRSVRSGNEISFEPEKGAAHPSLLERFDAVIHLAGEPIAEGRWTTEKKARIRDSRVTYTRRLAETLGALRRPPSVMISASAMGFYGDRGDRILRESDGPGEGFLPEVATEWEKATEPAEHAGIRVAHLRTGLVLTPKGGALAPMLLPFRFGAGGPLGSGGQWWSFITLDDMVYLIHHVLTCDKVRGPVNASTPAPVTNREFTEVLARVVRRPAVIPAPAFALRLVLGEMAGPLLFASARMNPERALDTGFEFAYPTLEASLRHVLGRES